MNKRTERLLDKIHKILDEYNQKTKIIKFESCYIKLSNGFELNTSAERQKIVRRILKSKNDDYKINFDKLYSTDVNERNDILKKIKQKICIKGGKACQEKHGERLKEILRNAPSWNKGTKGLMNIWNKDLTKETDSRLKNFSNDRKGKGNPMYGKTHSEKVKEFLSQNIKQKILNGEFTPNIHNSRTHFQSKTKDGKKFRSSWEAAFHVLNKDYEYEKIRIPYIHKEKYKIYIVDFVSDDKKELIEIKPSCHKDNKIFREKKEAAEKWCIKRNYKFIVLDEKYFIDNFDKIDMDELNLNSKKNLRKLYENYKNKKNKKT